MINVEKNFVHNTTKHVFFYVFSTLLFLLAFGKIALADSYTTNNGTDYIDTAYSYSAGGSNYNAFAQKVVLTSGGNLTSISVCTNNQDNNSRTSKVEIQADSSGLPSGTPIATSNTSVPSNGYSYTTFTFSSGSISSGTYWILIEDGVAPSGELYRPCGSSSGSDSRVNLNGTWGSGFGSGELGLTLYYSSATPTPTPSGTSTPIIGSTYMFLYTSMILFLLQEFAILVVFLIAFMIIGWPIRYFVRGIRDLIKRAEY